MNSVINEFAQSQEQLWHLCTPGNLSGVLFVEKKDFEYGMNATALVLDAFVRFIGYKGNVPGLSLDAPENPLVKAADEQEALLSIYSPLDDTAMLKKRPADFENLRNSYKLRREPSSYKIVIDGI